MEQFTDVPDTYQSMKKERTANISEDDAVAAATLRTDQGNAKCNEEKLADFLNYDKSCHGEFDASQKGSSESGVKDEQLLFDDESIDSSFANGATTDLDHPGSFAGFGCLRRHSPETGKDDPEDFLAFETRAIDAAFEPPTDLDLFLRSKDDHPELGKNESPSDHIRYNDTNVKSVSLSYSVNESDDAAELSSCTRARKQSYKDDELNDRSESEFTFDDERSENLRKDSEHSSSNVSPVIENLVPRTIDVDKLPSVSVPKDDQCEANPLPKVEDFVPAPELASTSPNRTSTNASKEPAKDRGEKSGEIGPKELFSKYGLDKWFNPECLNPTVEAYIYWRDPKLSGIVFASGLVLLLSLAYFSLISVVANTGLGILICAIVFRIYKDILQAVQKTPQTHPYSVFLNQDIQLPREKVSELVDTVILHINACLGELRRLFLVEDMIESLKFALVLWVLTYVGSWFNGLTLVIIGFVALFTLPKVYENNKVQIDQNLALARIKLEELTTKIKDALPAPLRRKLPEKKE